MRTVGVLASVVVLLACSGKKQEAAGSGSGSASAQAEEVVDNEAESVKLQLKAIGELARSYQKAKGTYLEGKVGPTPAKACCDQPKSHCYQTDSDSADPVWTALGHKETMMYTRYRYAYEGDRLAFTVTATADIECDGKPTSYQIKGSYDADNMARVTEPEQVTP
jgi:hypothetical protein